jgi:hypothetical protein
MYYSFRNGSKSRTKRKFFYAQKTKHSGKCGKEEMLKLIKEEFR